MLGLDTIPPPTVFRKPVSITQDTSSTFTMFRLSVVLSGDPDLTKHASADGSDILFTDGTTELPSEVVAYDGAGSLEAWVAVPTLPPGVTTIYLMYGADARTSQPSDVWSKAYVGVWHFSGKSKTESDSSSHVHTVTSIGVAPNPTTGLVGEARHFDAVLHDALCGGDADGSLAFATTDSFTYEAWVRPTAQTNEYVTLAKGATDTLSAGFDLEVSNGDWEAHFGDGVGAHFITLMGPLPNAWSQQVVVVDRGQQTVSAYIDGAFAMSSSITGFDSPASTEPLCFGGESDGTFGYGGDFDEASIQQVVREADWIRFEYENVTERGQVISLGAEQAQPAD